MKKICSLFLPLFISVSAFAAGHTVTTSATPVTCFGMCNGSTMSIVGGGVGPFTYSWAPSGGTGAGASGLCAGSYTVTVTDNSDMSTATASVAVTSPTALNVTITGGGAVCTGGCTNLTANATGGTAGYTFNWAPVAGITPVYSACPASGTTYTVTVADMNGCVATATSTLAVIPPPTVTVPSTYSICMGSCTVISATATGGSTFVWTPFTGLSSTTTANPTCCLPTTTTYTVTANFAGCTATATTTVFASGPMTSGISSVNTSGCATCDGTISAAPTGGLWPYTYSWGSATMTGVCAGTYSLTITDTAGCTTTDSTTVFANNSTIANFTMVPDSTNPYNFFCFNSSVGTGNSYAWDFADGVVSIMASPTHTYALPGTYNVCLIASNFLCGADTLCQNLSVTGVSTPCNALFNIADDTLNPDPNAHYVYNLSYGATLTYLWDFGDGTTSTSATPSHVYSGTGPYLLCLSIDNGAGCTDMYCDSLISADSINRSSGTMQLVVYDVPTFYTTATGIVNAMEADNVTIAPNPFNETTIFTVNSNEIYSFELTDVLGKTVKSKTGISEKQFEISREGLENGIYFYKIFTSESIVGIGKVIIK